MLMCAAVVGLAMTDVSVAAPAKPIKVFVLAGQSNMQGYGDITKGEGDLETAAKEYETNMINFIKDIRKDLTGIAGKPGTGEAIPFVIASSGMGGVNYKWPPLIDVIEPAQLAAAQKSPNSAGVPTRAFQRHMPGGQKYHWYNSAESYCLVGDASAKAMIELLKKKK